jgi:Prokaryotic N-terminal methylation motif
MYIKTPNHRNDRHSERGLTAVELVVSMAIFLIVVAAVYGVLRIGNMSRTSINSRSENIKNVRMAINSIGREAVNAGLGYNRIGGTVPDDFAADNFGVPADADDNDDLLTAITSGSNISESDLSAAGARNDIVAFAFRDFQFNDGFPIVINDAKEEGGKLILKTPDGACANCRPYDLFLIETGDGKKAIILSTDVINNNTIVLGGDEDPLSINYGKKSQKNAQKRFDKAEKELQKKKDEQKKAQDDLAKAIAKGDLKKILDLQNLLTALLGDLSAAQAEYNAALLALGGSGSQTAGSAVKKCPPGDTEKCISYSGTTVVAKKIYLVSYSVGADGTLIRTTFGNNTGAGADDQIVRQPIANGVKNFKVSYLLSDGTTTNDPSEASTQNARNNEIVQIDVTVTVDSEKGNEPITLNSTFSTRNLKYDVY